MAGERIYLFDTTLRDGAQTQGVDFSVPDKLADRARARLLGIDYVEGGWPGANPTDDAFFAKLPAARRTRKLAAFGMTRRAGRSAANDPGLAARARQQRARRLPRRQDLGFPRQGRARRLARRKSRDDRGIRSRAPAEQLDEAMFDAEHFFDGYKANPDYRARLPQGRASTPARAGSCCATPMAAPCRTRSSASSAKWRSTIPGDQLGIHAHNDTENAVANSLAAVRAGARQVQGTLNGLGERCGNANLVALIPTLMLKMGYATGVETSTGLTRA